ncbi:hypothetical protein ABK046_42210 [Streptomyces caeruleatus]
MIATVPPCVDVPGDLGVAEETFPAMMRERDRIDADIAHLIETRDALDVLVRANSRHRRRCPRPGNRWRGAVICVSAGCPSRQCHR